MWDVGMRKSSISANTLFEEQKTVLFSSANRKVSHVQPLA